MRKTDPGIIPENHKPHLDCANGPLCLAHSALEQNGILRREGATTESGHCLGRLDAKGIRLLADHAVVFVDEKAVKAAHTEELRRRWQCTAGRDPMQLRRRIICTGCRTFGLDSQCAHSYAAYMILMGEGAHAPPATKGRKRKIVTRKEERKAAAKRRRLSKAHRRNH